MIDADNFKRIKRRIKLLVAQGKIAPALAIEARKGGDVKQAPSEGRKRGPKGNARKG